ncbi:MAG TPA: bifunctional nuclease family protein [Dehalococcoidia bacterium]|nr:bifunctional nuclease family protein [Dehalococcoidia bacterium]
MAVVEMLVDSIRVSLMNYQRVVILKQKDAERYLPIWIGPAEADAIAVRLQDIQVARPLTHDLLRTILDTLGAAVRYIVVNDLANDTFYAHIILEVDGRTLEIDSRPSDAIALAVRAQVPIFAEDTVLQKAGVYLDKEEEEAEESGVENSAEPRSQPSAEELKKMSAFKDFLESLDLGDLEKGTG